MPKVDLRQYKNDLRREMRGVRKMMSPALRQEKDRLIFQRLIRLPQYQTAHTLICYVSSPREVGTLSLICHALENGKKVAVPRCVPGTHLMEMFYIRSLDELTPGSYDILEPSPKAPRCRSWKNSICIVPAFCNDREGYRLGYGGGYYDRFLSKYTGVTVGINYSECIRDSICHGRYDIPIQMVMTERELIRIKPLPCLRHNRPPQCRKAPCKGVCPVMEPDEK